MLSYTYVLLYLRGENRVYNTRYVNYVDVLNGVTCARRVCRFIKIHDKFQRVNLYTYSVAQWSPIKFKLCNLFRYCLFVTIKAIERNQGPQGQTNPGPLPMSNIKHTTKHPASSFKI